MDCETCGSAVDPITGSCDICESVLFQVQGVDPVPEHELHRFADDGGPCPSE